VTASFLVAPTMFHMLPRQTAGQVMGTIFGHYYLMGMVLGLIALAATVLLGMRGGWHRSRWLTVVLLVAMVAAAGHSRYAIAPQIIEVRGQMWQAPEGSDDAGKLHAQMDRLHHLAVALNGAMLLMGLVLIGLDARREKQHD